MTSSPLSRRRILQTTLAGAGAAAVGAGLVGCAPGGTSGDKPKGLENVPKATLPEPRSGITYPDGYIGPKAYDRKPITGGKTFRIVVAQDATVVGDWNNNKWTTECEKRTGLKIEFVPVLVRGTDGTIDMTKINAMLAGGELPDAFMGIPFTTAQLALYGKQGVFIALDDYIDTYSPMTKQAMADYPDLRSLRASPDGKLYTMLGVNDCFHCRSSPGRAWVSKSYLEKVGAAMPTTTDELRQVLLEFKNKNPSGKSGFLPFASSESSPMDTFFMNSFLPNPGDQQTGNAPWLRLNNGKVEFTATMPEWREGLRYLNQLGKDGTLTRATFTMKDTELQQNGNKGLVGFTRAYWWGSFFKPVNLGLDEPWRDYVAVPPLKGPNGVQHAWWNYYGYATDGLQITKKCADPGQLVQWVDLVMDLEANLWSYGGVLGDNWDYAKQGDKGINDKQAIFSRKLFPAPVGTSWSQYAVLYRSNDYRLAEKVDPAAPTFEAGLYQAGKAYEKFALPQETQLPPIVFNAADSAMAADTTTAIRAEVKVALAKFALGDLDPNSDGDWQAYVEKFQSMNLNGLIDIYQKAYDSRPK